MSSGSSEADVIRTRIPTYDDDNTVLYAYEPNKTFINDVKGTSDMPCSETQQKTVEEVLTHCQVIYDAIQNLDKKFDLIDGKVSKMHRCRRRSWENYKSHQTSDCSNCKRNKHERVNRKGSPAVFNYPESYSPTLPVGRRGSDSQTNYDGSSLPSEGPTDLDRSVCDEQDQDFNQTSALIGIQGEFNQEYDHEVMGYSDVIENKNVGQHTLCAPSSFVGSSGSEFHGLYQSYLKDPSDWSVDEVILFIRQTDPQISVFLEELFRQHDIDGKALLLLKSDTMMKYMGLKLGTAVKLCHYIERLKQENYLTG
ncbi:sex comb on midleg-like protein 1 [Orycteropus afer afer]|uniref:Sex comb on midleg-like protein 1 n=1 Tax=Orycteropus afer afer TaxID=1230840 RepID=A0A8B7B5V5_ORYAF|nr:sex comb on midleg-like protein 1 [Orycteropus afer afer]